MTPRDREALDRVLVCVEAIDAYVSRTGADWPAEDRLDYYQFLVQDTPQAGSKEHTDGSP